MKYHIRHLLENGVISLNKYSTQLWLLRTMSKCHGLKAKQRNHPLDRQNNKKDH